MAKCIYCHKEAGFLRHKHRACLQKYNQNKEAIDKMIESSFFSTGDFKKVKQEIEKLAKEGYVSTEDLKKIYISNYDIAVQKFLYDGILTNEEEKKLAEFKTIVHLDQDVLDQYGLFQKFIKAVIVRDLAQGKTPPVNFDTVGDIPFTFKKGEKIIWLFQEVEIYEQKNTTRLQKKQVRETTDTDGDSYFQKTFKTKPVNPKTIKFVDTGMFIITNKNIYFVSDLIKFKTDFQKICSLLPYEDGIGFQKNKTAPNTWVFRRMDGRFAYNVLTNLNT